MKMAQKTGDPVQLGGWTFHVIAMEDQKLFSSYIKDTNYPANLWSSCFAYIWACSQSRTRTILWRVVDDMLAVFVYTRNGTLYLHCLPFGPGNAQKVVHTTETCLRFCLTWNQMNASVTKVKMINENQLAFLRQDPAFEKDFRLVTWQGIERHMDVAALSGLHGGRFANVRNRVNKFYADHPEARVCEYEPDDYREVMQLSGRWRDTSGTKYSSVFDGVYFGELVRHVKELAQRILLLKNDGKIIGMIAGSALPSGESWGSVMKFEEGISGLSETLIVEFARLLHREYPQVHFINTGSDLGRPGLRAYKLKFCPVLNFKRYQMFFRGASK